MSIIATPNLTITAGAPPAGLGDPDPTQLYELPIVGPFTNRVDPDYSTYNTYSTRAMASGGTYVDPVTGVTVIKITTASTPYSNAGMMNGIGYTDGGNCMSMPWVSDGDDYITVATYQGVNQRTWLVDLKLTGSGAPSLHNWRELTGSLQPQADLAFSFSCNTSNPQVAYVVNGNSCHRIITESGSMALADTGNFPWSIGAVGASPWMHHDKNDDWFVSTSDSGTCRVWQSSTDTKRTASYNPNEGRLSRDGLYTLLSAIGIVGGYKSTFRVWDHVNNTYSSQGAGANAHCATMQSLWGGTDWDADGGGNPWGMWTFGVDAVWNGDRGGTNLYPTTHYDYNETHSSGNWIQDVARDSQWFTSYGMGGGTSTIWAKRGVGLLKADGTDSRLICHTYNEASWGDYYALPFANISPSGHLVCWTSRMASSDSNMSSRYDLFVAIMPRAA